MKYALKVVVQGAALLACATAFANPAPQIERVFRPARLTRGNTGVRPVQEIDQAAWIAHPDDADIERLAPAPRAVRYRCRFTSDGSPFAFDVTGDERFLLTLDGAFVSRGPHRGWVENWLYQSYRVALPAGEHVMEATVWRLGGQGPIAQLSYRPGFCLKAQGFYDAALTTGRGKWECGVVANFTSIGRGKTYGVGDGFEIVGAGAEHAEPAAWTPAVVVRAALGEGNRYCGRQKGWMLFPSQLPDQLAACIRPGRFVKGGEMKFPFVVPAGETRTIVWDLGRYVCAYPEAVVRGGKGGSMTWQWAESLRDEKGLKGNRAEWEGKSLRDGFGDRFTFDGRDRAVFGTPWWRCGRWCELVVAAGAEPVTVEDLALVETRYPLECETAFVTPDDPGLADVQRICARTMQMCCHEMFFDCPFYEQQMYPGDSRVELNVLSAMSSDDRMIRRVIETFALKRCDDGNVPFTFPTRGTQEGATYTLCYLGMYADYVMNHANRDWLKARLPAMTDTLRGFEFYEREDGLLANLPGWLYMDSVLGRPAWKVGWAPGSRDGGTNAEINLFYLAALQGAARIEAAFGNTHLAAHWNAKAAKLKPAVAAAFFDARRGLFASDAAHTVFAEHAQCLALLTDVFEGERAQTLFETFVAAPDLDRASVYFSYYLFETYFKFGRADLFMKRLGMWRDFVKCGLTTTPEVADLRGTARSDCHAWSSHPLWFLRTGVAGIRSAAPFFERVKVAPQPGSLKSFRATYPHPSGKLIEVDLKFANGRAMGTIATPVPGVFVYGSQTIDLAPGTTEIK